MRFKLCLAATGSKSVIEDLDRAMGVEGAVRRALRPKEAPGSDSTARWLWQTKYRAADSSFPEDVLKDLLVEHKHRFSIINARRRNLDEVVGTIIAQFDPQEQPRGYSFSSEAIKLLAEIGASLEIDAVSVMTPADEKI